MIDYFRFYLLICHLEGSELTSEISKTIFFQEADYINSKTGEKVLS